MSDVNQGGDIARSFDSFSIFLFCSLWSTCTEHRGTALLGMDSAPASML